VNIEEECENLFDSLRKVLFYAGHGKYNDLMSLDEVEGIKNSLEKILSLEDEYNLAKTSEEKMSIYKRLEPYKTYSIRDFLEHKIEKI